jgi:hypothetical protein
MIRVFLALQHPYLFPSNFFPPARIQTTGAKFGRRAYRWSQHIIVQR